MADARTPPWKDSFQWDDQMRLLLGGIPSAAFWIRPSLQSLLEPMVNELGAPLYRLLVAYHAAIDSDADIALVRSRGGSFEEGFAQWIAAATTVGWGRFELTEFDREQRRAVITVWNPWELLLQDQCPARWGCPFLQGKFIAIFSHVFGETCWAEDLQGSCAKKDCSVRIEVEPSDRTILEELEALRVSRETQRSNWLSSEVARSTLRLRESQESQRAILSSIGDLVMTLDRDGILTNLYLPEGEAELYPRAAVGEPIEASWPGSACAALREVLREVTAGGEGGAKSLTAVVSGRERSYSGRFSPLRDARGAVIGMTGVVRDVTEEKALEAELFRARKLESIGQLAGGIAHDFNNYLTSILGHIGLARRRATDDGTIRGVLETAERACSSAQGLTQQLLTFSKGGAPIKEAASVAEILRESAEFSVRGSNVRCEYRLDPALWPAEVDRGQFSQVVNNLVLNADQAMPGGGVIVIRAENLPKGAERASSLADLEDEDLIAITIEDSGAGMSPETLERVFDPYFTTKEEGSGLGLATAHSIVVRHGGRILAESELGAGTRFTIILPRARLDPRPRPPTRALERRVGRGRILVMDDNAAIRAMTAELLEELGYGCESVNDGEEAIARFEAAREAGAPFDLVIMDLTIPGGMGGTAAVQLLKERDPEVRVIVSSGYSTDPVMAEYERYGFCGRVAKPYRIEELQEAVARALGEAAD